MTDKNNIIVYGTGGLGRGVVDLINSINRYSLTPWNIVGFVDDFNNKGKVNGIPVLGDIDYLFKIKNNINVVIAFGSPKTKQKIVTKLSPNNNIKYPNIIHPSVDISQYNHFGYGNIISNGVAMSTNIEIG